MLEELKKYLSKQNITEFGVTSGELCGESWAKSIVVCAFFYDRSDIPGSNIAKFARFPDYHTGVRNILSGANDILAAEHEGYYTGKTFCDTEGYDDRLIAYSAGLGVIGTNHTLIHPRYGSFFVIGGIITNLTLPLSSPIDGGCRSCGICKAACPSRALEHGMDMCISGVSQKKGEFSLADEEIFKKGQYMWGCDICQDVCPMNKGDIAGVNPYFTVDMPRVGPFSIENLNNYKNRSWAWRGSKVLMRNYKLINDKSP